MAKNTMNAVFLHGRMATDVDLKYTDKGTERGSFLIAVDKINSEEADFFRIIVWGQQAKLASDYIRKGDSVIIQGSLRSYKDKQDHLQMNIVARHITFPPKGGRSDEKYTSQDKSEIQETTAGDQADKNTQSKKPDKEITKEDFDDVPF